MPSDLQRVAQGLVECLDEVPGVVQHLQRTAERCRENAALAIIASQGRATVAAQQLDAAARSCEEAAHYLSMAPPKAKAWASRLVGGGSSSGRPDAASADRNKATGGIGDVALRDSQGRTRRLSAPLKPLDDAEGNEPPLIKVARKALEKLRKQQQKDEKEREDRGPLETLEVEIEVTPDGRAVVVEDQDAPEERDYEISVDINEAATELLHAMTTNTPTWQTAVITITTDHVTATFDYPDLPEPSSPPIIDVELPPPSDSAGDQASVERIEVPEIDAALDDLADFDPAFHPRARGDNFAPGIHDPLGAFEPKEVEIAELLERRGWRIDARLEDHGSWAKNPDAMVRRTRGDVGIEFEFKTPRSGASNAIKRNILDASEQVPPNGEVVIDGRNVDLSQADAFRAYRRAVGQPGKTTARVVHLILGDGRLITYTKES
ncbi:hypothetical protein F1D05_37765 [Kribbella qitaiheensis]|uniref:tRNA nuclease CdiA C-terminal domain-containing protein n=1 Tax=Kribbella qitaiheensis TaxID=1544730 RepID=A0A7G6X8N5_9ACTN|nr:hypothetical protein [Kribbella qitaiheensis]QNE22600.1 hypothetical protein F1D05_37765 [Kribbella qitaiheensis]